MRQEQWYCFTWVFFLLVHWSQQLCSGNGGNIDWEPGDNRSFPSAFVGNIRFHSHLQVEDMFGPWVIPWSSHILVAVSNFLGNNGVWWVGRGWSPKSSDKLSMWKVRMSWEQRHDETRETDKPTWVDASLLLSRLISPWPRDKWSWFVSICQCRVWWSSGSSFELIDPVAAGTKVPATVRMSYGRKEMDLIPDSGQNGYPSDSCSRTWEVNELQDMLKKRKYKKRTHISVYICLHLIHFL